MIEWESLRSRSYEDQGGDHICLLCGKTIKNYDSAMWVYLVQGNSCIGTPEEAEKDDSAGAFPIGPGCYRKNKKVLSPYAQKNTS